MIVASTHGCDLGRSAPDDASDVPWPSMTLVVDGDGVIRKGSRARFQIGWDDMPIDAAISIQLVRLPISEKPHLMRSGYSIGSIMRIHAASGQAHAEWTPHDRMENGEYHLTAAFVEGSWIESRNASIKTPMPSRKPFETFIGPMVRISAAPTREHTLRGPESTPANVGAIAAELSSLKVTDAMELVRALQDRWDMKTIEPFRQSWPEIDQVVKVMCGVGMKERLVRHPLFYPRYDDNMGPYPEWDVVLAEIGEDHVPDMVEAVKTLWSCGTAQALHAVRNVPTELKRNMYAHDVEDLLRKYESMQAQFHILRSV